MGYRAVQLPAQLPARDVDTCDAGRTRSLRSPSAYRSCESGSCVSTGMSYEETRIHRKKSKPLSQKAMSNKL